MTRSFIILIIPDRARMRIFTKCCECVDFFFLLEETLLVPPLYYNIPFLAPTRLLIHRV